MQEDEGKGIIRIDGLVRRNVGVSLGDKVEVRKAEVLPAERITIAPIISEGHKISFGQGIENFVKRGLLKRPLNKGDVVIVPGIALMGGALPFMVISTAPKGVVQIQDDTIIEMKEEPLREKFEEAQKNAPSVLFIDELDSIAPKREEVTGEVERRVVAQLLTLMDGLSGRGQVIVIGATNRDEAIDPALRRPGRFDREIEIGVPDRMGRKEILQIHTRGMPIEGAEEERDRLQSELADVCHGFVGADLAALAREAAMKALRRYLPDIDFDRPTPAETLEPLHGTQDAAWLGCVAEVCAMAHVRAFDTDSGGSEGAVNQLRSSMAGRESPEGVCVVGATDRPDRLDPARLRTGRFDRILLVPTPNRDARLAILKVHTKTMPLDGVDLEELAVDLDGYSGADIEGLCRESAMIALRETKHAKKVTMVHFQEAIKVVRPSIDADTIKFYEEFDKKFKKAVERGRREENILYR